MVRTNHKTLRGYPKKMSTSGRIRGLVKTRFTSGINRGLAKADACLYFFLWKAKICAYADTKRRSKNCNILRTSFMDGPCHPCRNIYFYVWCLSVTLHKLSQIWIHQFENLTNNLGRFILPSTIIAKGNIITIYAQSWLVILLLEISNIYL